MNDLFKGHVVRKNTCHLSEIKYKDTFQPNCHITNHSGKERLLTCFKKSILRQSA